jgi:peptide/nickel transport system permease protein
MKVPKGFGFPIAFIFLLVFISIFADFLSSNHPSAQNLDHFFVPPSPIHFFEENGEFHGRPFIYHTELTDPLDVEYSEQKETAFALEFFYKGYGYKLFGLIPWDRHLMGRSLEPFYFPLGADELGRDVLAKILAGTRTSLLVVLLGMVIYAVLGITIGALAGLLGGWIDSVLMRFSEFVLALPVLYLVLALRALLPMSVPFWQSLFFTIAIIAAVAWPPMARGIRGLILQLKHSTFVEAARSLGGTPIHIFRHHMFPSLLPFVLTQTALAAPIFLLGEVILAFLNVGFQDSGESWGSMLRSLKDARIITDFWWNLLPLAMVFLTLLCLNLLGGRLRTREPDNQVMRI